MVMRGRSICRWPRRRPIRPPNREPAARGQSLRRAHVRQGRDQRRGRGHRRPGYRGRPDVQRQRDDGALTGATNAQYVTVAVSNAAAADGGTGGSGSIRLGLLAGDVNGNRAVTLADVLGVSTPLTQPVAGANYLRDVNANGTLSLADTMFVNAELTQALPVP